MAGPALEGMLFGGLSLFGWGLVDFFLKLNVSRLGPGPLFVGMQLAVLPVLGFGVWALQLAKPLAWGTVGLLFVLSLFYLLANIGFFRALAEGEVAVVIPIAASWSVAAAILGWAVLGDRLTAGQWLAISCNLAGILLLSVGGAPRRSAQGGGRFLPAGVDWAILSLVAFSLMNTMLKPVTQEVGAVATTLWLKGLAGAAGGLGLLVLQRPVRVEAAAASEASEKAPALTGRDLGWFAALGLLDAAGILGYNLGVSRAPVGIVAPVAASSPVVTLTLAALFLGERPSARQWTGAGLVVLSLIALAALA